MRRSAFSVTLLLSLTLVAPAWAQSGGGKVKKPAVKKKAATPTSKKKAASPSVKTGGDAAMEVVISPGAKALEPMAIPVVKCIKAPPSLCRTLTSVFRRNMLLSFYVRVLRPRSYIADPTKQSLDKIHWVAWSQVGAKHLIKAEIIGPAPYRVEARLYSVAEKKVIPVTPQSFTGVRERGIRKVGHRFCNGVMRALTGKAGVFDTRIAFTARTGLRTKVIGIMDMDGGRRGGLIRNGSVNLFPSWGMGGIFYTSFKRGKPDIYFGKRRISQDAGHYRKVAVSRDGSKLVASISYGGQSDLYLLNKAGKRLKNLTRSGADEVSPTFSPNGDKIAFVSSASGGPQIYVMSASGGAKKRLTHAGSYNYAPDWGANGLIVFSGMDGNRSDVFTVTEGGVMQRLTQGQGSNRYPSWSPDGRYVAFVGRRKGKTRIWLMSADGRYQYPVSRGAGVSNIAWQR